MEILRCFPGILLVLSSLQAANPSCRTPLGVPCHVIQYEWSQWILFEKGITDVRHVSGQMTSGVRRDGSRYGEIVVDGSQRVENLYLAPSDKVIKIIPADQTYSIRDPRMWHDRPYRRSRDGDAWCSTGILHNGTDFHQDAQISEMLGMKIVHWSRPLANGGSEDLYMAPDLDCTVMKHRTVHNNAFHLPRFIRNDEATRIRLEEPSSALFTVPATYRKVEPPQLPRLQ